MAKKRYRMTHRRRAAIKKAQAASARKRRLGAAKSGAKFVGYVAGASVAAAATYGVNVYLRDSARDLAKGRKPRGPLSPPRKRDALPVTQPTQTSSFPVKPIKGMRWIS